MSFSIDRNITTVWNEWRPGFYPEMEGCTFREVIFDKAERNLQIRLVFEQNINAQQILNLEYEWLPGSFQIILDCIGKRVLSVEAQGTKEHCAYVVRFDDGNWFKI